MMNRIEKYLEQNVKSYIDIVRTKQAEGKTLVIYGAGKIAKGLYSFLKDSEITVNFFCVTEIADSSKELFGLPVCAMADVQENINNNVCFLIGVGQGLHSEIVGVLKKNKISEFIKLPVGVSVLMDERFNRPLIQVTPKTGCNVNCHYCPQELYVKNYYSMPRPGMMSLKDYKMCLDKVPKDAVIEFAGFVEPFLNPEAAEMMLYTASTGREVNLFTSLVGMTWNTWEKIKDIPFTLVVVHLPDVDGYANIPMTEEYWKILKAMVEGKKPTGNPFIDRVNSQSAINPKVMEVVGGRVHVDTTPLIDRAGNLESKKLRSGSVEYGPLFCSTAAKLNHNILLPDGSLVLCCMDFGMKHVLGNLLKEDYDDIMQGDVMNDIVSKMCVNKSKGLLCRTCVRAVPMVDAGRK